MRHRRTFRISVSAVLPGLLCSCIAQPQAKPQPAPPAPAGASDLSSADRPSGLTLRPPPPATASAALALDEAESRRDLAMHGGARWQMAVNDAVLTS